MCVCVCVCVCVRGINFQFVLFLYFSHLTVVIKARNEAQLSHSAAIRAEQLIGEERRRLSQEQELREEVS